MALSTRSTDFFVEGAYTGKMTTQIGYGSFVYEGYAEVNVTLTQYDDKNFNAKVKMTLTGSNCSRITERLIFPLKQIELTAKFATSEIKETISAKGSQVTVATVVGTADIPFVQQLPSFLKIKDGKIDSSTTVEKDAAGNISAKVSMFGVVTMFGSIRKNETMGVEAKEMLRLGI